MRQLRLAGKALKALMYPTMHMFGLALRQLPAGWARPCAHAGLHPHLQQICLAGTSKKNLYL